MSKLISSIFFSLFLIGTLSAQEWYTDISQAKEAATSQNRDIILVFQGSDWCASCIKLDHEIWNTDEFKQYAAEHYIMLKADFPKRKKNALDPALQEKNNQLAAKYNTNGFFPLVLKLNKSGDVLGSTGYKKISVTEYIALLNSFNS